MAPLMNGRERKTVTPRHLITMSAPHAAMKAPLIPGSARTGALYLVRPMPASRAIRTSWLRVLTPVLWNSC